MRIPQTRLKGDVNRRGLLFLPTRFTESMRIPVTRDNRQYLCAARAAELQLWVQMSRRTDRARASSDGR